MKSNLEAWGWYYDDLRARQASTRTIRTYHASLRMFWASIDPKPWHKATPRDLERWIDRPAPHRSGRLAPATQAGYSRHVLIFYRRATAEGLIVRNPLRKVVAVRHPDPIPRALDLADVRTLLERLDDDRARLMVWLGYGCGMRACEIAAARVEDIRLHGRPSILVHGKGRRQRVVPIPTSVVEELRSHLARRPMSGPLVQARDRAGEPNGRHLLPATVSHLLGRAMHAAGLAESGHALRHTYATELLAADQGRNLHAVSRLLGHASTAITEQVYVCGYDADAWAAVALLPDPRTA